MKFLPLIWAGIWRKPGRTILIVLQVAVAFVLFGVLQGMKTGVEAAKYGWKVGDRIPLTSVTLKRDGSGSWVFDVVGTFTPHEVNGGSFIVGNYTYLDEARMTNKGTVRNFYVAASDPRSAAAVSEAIDRTFANAPSETNTASLRESAQQAMQRIGDLNFMVRAILTPVFAALLFSIGTLLLQGIRERTPELAVLKTLGFTDRAIFLLILAEAGLVCVSGSLIGLGLAMLAFPYTAKWIPGLSMPVVVIAAGVLVACLVALLSAALPARRAARLRVVDALAGR